MNNCIFAGRLVKQPTLEVKGEMHKLAFNLAVRRTFKNKEGKYDADFPRFTAWGHNADYLAQYAQQGDIIEVVADFRTEKRGDRYYESFRVVSTSILSHAAPSQPKDDNLLPEPPTEFDVFDTSFDFGEEM